MTNLRYVGKPIVENKKGPTYLLTIAHDQCMPAVRWNRSRDGVKAPYSRSVEATSVMGRIIQGWRRCQLGG